MLKRQRAVIIEQDCIGCSRCLDHCPVDCIIGAPKQLHNILEQECIGCGLCVDPCPVDCIIIQEVELTAEQTKQLAEIAKYRHKQKTLRKHQEQQLVLSYIAKEAEVSAMQQEIAQIVERQKNKPNNFKIYGQEE